LVESRDFVHTLPAFDAPVWGDRHRNFAKMFITKKTDWAAIVLKKVWRYVKPFRYNTVTWQTDRQTDGRNC